MGQPILKCRAHRCTRIHPPLDQNRGHFGQDGSAMPMALLADPLDQLLNIVWFSPAARGQKVEVEYVQTFIAVS